MTAGFADLKSAMDFGGWAVPTWIWGGAIGSSCWIWKEMLPSLKAYGREDDRSPIGNQWKNGRADQLEDLPEFMAAMADFWEEQGVALLLLDLCP
ncbi:hypothetical protein ACLOJK_022468 [Asimina triloba]